jgi:hypothetical protein
VTRGGGALLGAAVAAFVLALSACSGGDEPAARPRPAPPATTEVTSPTASTTDSAPSPGSMDEPATTSGPLSRRSFPTPRQLGAGWRYAVDPGSVEEGYSGNGTPTLERNPQEIVQTAVPFGCDRPFELTAPTHALEVDYTVAGAKAIAVRGKFGDAAEARSFFAGRARNLRGCEGRAGSPAIGPLVMAVTAPAREALANDRTPRSDPWRELAVLDRDTVVLLAVQGTDPLTAAQTRRLVAAFRR